MKLRKAMQIVLAVLVLVGAFYVGLQLSQMDSAEREQLLCLDTGG